MEYVGGRYKVFGDSLQIYGDGMYSHYRQDNGWAGTSFLLADVNTPTDLTEIRSSIFNPFGDRLTGVAGNLQQELGNRRATFDKDWWRGVVGAKGEFNFIDNAFISRLGYDVGMTYERFDDTETIAGDAVRSKFRGTGSPRPVQSVHRPKRAAHRCRSDLQDSPGWDNRRRRANLRADSDGRDSAI